MVDMDGKMVNEWEITGIPAKMYPGGILIGGKGTGTAQGGSETFARVDWKGNELTDVWGGQSVTDIVADKLFGGVHHDFQVEGSPAGYYSPSTKQEPKPFGKMLVLGNYYPCGPKNGYFQAVCNTGQNDTNDVSPNFNLMDDVFYEIEDGKVTFEWHHYQHVDQMGYDDKARAAVATMFSGPPGFGGSDWQHSNTVDYLGENKWYNCEGKNCVPDERFHPDNILYDSRTSNYLAIIARHDDPDGKWEAGDIVWRVGPDFTPGHAESKLDQIIGPHMAHMIPEGLPGAGNILVFDNGGVAGYGSLLPGLPGYYPNTFRDFSRVIEFNPKSLEIVWEYKKPVGDLEGRKFYSRFISGAQRLPNGNTLITDGCYGRVFEVTRGGNIVWEYINPNFDKSGGGGPPIPSIGSNAVYRAYRVPAEWVSEWVPD